MKPYNPDEYWRERYLSNGRSYVARNSDPSASKIQFDRIAPLIRKIPEVDRLLDFGSGPGRFQGVLGERAKEIEAIDLVPDALDDLRKAYPATKTSVFELPLPYGPESFGAVWACTVLQHVVDEKIFGAICREIGRILVPGGSFFVVDDTRARNFHVVARNPIKIGLAMKVANCKVAGMEFVDIDSPASHYFCEIRKV